MRIKPASPFPWRSTELDFKLALHPHSRFTPLIECCVPPFGREGHSYSGSYFGLGIWHDRCGYLATLGYRHSFRECEFPLKDFDALRKRLKAISIPLDGGALAFDGPQGLIVFTIATPISISSTAPPKPQWDPLVKFINQTSDRFLPANTDAAR
jgi:hypothetical protein